MVSQNAKYKKKNGIHYDINFKVERKNRRKYFCYNSLYCNKISMSGWFFFSKWSSTVTTVMVRRIRMMEYVCEFSFSIENSQSNMDGISNLFFVIVGNHCTSIILLFEKTKMQSFFILVFLLNISQRGNKKLCISKKYRLTNFLSFFS